MKNNNAYIVQYNKRQTKLFTLRLNKRIDKDIIDFLDSLKPLGSVSGYIKLLIRNDNNFKDFHNLKNINRM